MSAGQLDSGQLAKPLRLRQLLELLQRVVLDLSDPLAGDAERAPHLLERQRLVPAEPVAQLYHLALALRQRIERPLDVLALKALGGGLERLLGGLVGDEDESELGDFVADDQTEEPFEAATENLQRADIQRALDALPERERQVIELRYGLRGHEPLTLEEVGRAFGVTRERIRQIENNTLQKLKQLPEAQRLRELA